MTNSWDTRGFTKTRTIDGTLTVPMMGDMPFQADVYMDAAGAVGSVSAEGPMGRSWLFVSLTEGGGVYTQPARRDGDVDLGGTRLVTVASQDRAAILDAHLAAVGDGALADRDALDAALDGAPQKAVDLASEVMQKMAAGLS